MSKIDIHEFITGNSCNAYPYVRISVKLRTYTSGYYFLIFYTDIIFNDNEIFYYSYTVLPHT